MGDWEVPAGWFVVPSRRDGLHGISLLNPERESEEQPEI